MTQKVADQHALLTCWREIADELAEALVDHPCHSPAVCGCDEALRRYEEARES